MLILYIPTIEHNSYSSAKDHGIPCLFMPWRSKSGDRLGNNTEDFWRIIYYRFRINRFGCAAKIVIEEGAKWANKSDRFIPTGYAWIEFL